MHTIRHRPLLWLGLFLLVLLFVATGAVVYADARAQGITGVQTVVIAPEVLRPGGETWVRAIVQDLVTGAPVAQAAVAVKLVPRAGGKAVTLYQGQTDAQGTVQAQVKVPTGLAPEQTLLIEARSRHGSEKLERAVQVRRDYKLLVTTDKPLYQPGQTIHLRALALSVGDLAPAAGQELEFVIEDPKGNKIHRSTINTSDWGIASLDFVLASEVNQGTYKIVPRLGQTTSEKTVTVKPYVLPKFKVTVETDRAFCQPGQTVEGTLDAGYFFGKPVSESKVELRGYLYEVQRREVVHVEGQTDADGHFAFRFELPRYFVGGTLEPGKATFVLEATVVDQAEHAELVTQALTVAEQPIQIEAVPESGMLKPGVENILYLLTTYPDGSPAETQLTIRVDGQTASVKTGAYGLAEWRYTPAPGKGASFQIEARDARGSRSTQTLNLPWQRTDGYVILRPERALYRVGETMHLDILASAERGAAYLDIVREGQTLSTRAIEFREGRAQADIDLDEGMYGTLQLRAYKVLQDATIVADTRLVIVDRATQVKLDVTAEQEQYRPGDLARLAFQTSIGDQPVPAALALSVVDESVFALQEQDAGFAKLYFLLQQELLQPKYQLKGFTPERYLPDPASAAGVRQTQDQITRAALAKGPTSGAQALTLPRAQKERAVQVERQGLYRRVTDGLGGLIAALSALGLLASVVGVAKQKRLRKSVVYSLAVLGGLALLALGISLILEISQVGLYSDAWAMLAVGLEGLGLVALVVLGILAWARHQTALQATYVLLLGSVLLLAVAGWTASRAAPNDWMDLIALPVLALALPPLGLLLGAIDQGFEGRWGTAAVGVAVSGLLLIPAALTVGGLLENKAALDTDNGRGAWAQEDGVVREFALAGGGQKMAAPAAAQPTRPAAVAVPAAAPTTGKAAPDAPRLREFFPETMYWNPEILTDDTGRAEVEIPVADSITTWRLSALASTQRGELGSATTGLRVFQDFFIDLDLPLYLTEGDEISLPVAVFNYLPAEQAVRLVVQEEEWFELLDEAEKTLDIASNDVEVVYFRIRARAFGTGRFQVTAWGERMSDAIVKPVQVLPDGKRFQVVQGGNLKGPVSQALLVPQQAIPGTPKVWVKVYPGIMSQMVEGLGGLLKMPFG